MFEDDVPMEVGADGPAAPTVPPGAGDLGPRRLRRHTKDALRRIGALVATPPGPETSAAGQRLTEEAERRIHLAARLCDALFGPTRAPGPLERRLRALAEGLAELLADPDQVIRVEVTCAGACPAALHGVVLRAAQELVGNAVEHAFHARLVGCVRVDLACGPRGIKLTVADDGWGLARESGAGQGLGLVRALVAPFGGTLAVRDMRDGWGTTAEVVLPPAVPDGRVVALAGRRGREAP